MTNWKLPFGLPVTLEGALQALGDRDWVKIAHNTWFLRKDDGEASVKFYLNDIVRLHRDGSYTLWANGFHDHAACRRLSDLAPVEVFLQDGVMRIRPLGKPSGRDVEFYDGIRVDRNGVPVKEHSLVA